MKRIRSLGFLPQVPAGDLHAWKARQRCRINVSAVENQNPVGADRAGLSHPSDSMEGRCFDVTGKRKRKDMPLVRSVDKGSLSRAELGAQNLASKQQSLDELLGDMYAGTSKKPRDALLKTWVKLHETWFGIDGEPPFPLTEIKLIRVSALFKRGLYKSFKNYASRAKDHHLSLGYEWSEGLNRTMQKCSRSVLRGLAGPSRSEPFDFPAVVKLLRHTDLGDIEGGPVHPLAMVVCSTYFLLRELEASSIDRGDITLHDSQVTLSLPVSKTDWEAKGCKRTWSCLCDRDLPCPFHILKSHCDSLDLHGIALDAPLFPDSSGNYCSKAGVVATIRRAAELAGMTITDPSGGNLLSGHTFLITGSRFLSACGLDPITLQLLGRWGSSAILTYLSESPLMSMSERVKPLERIKLSPGMDASAIQFKDFDFRVRALETLAQFNAEAQERRDIDSRLRQIEREQEHQGDIVEGISIAVQERCLADQVQVLNSRSMVVHKSLISLSRSPHTWKTVCGWSYAGKRHAFTIGIAETAPVSYKPCPKCTKQHSNQDSSSSSASSSSSED